MTARHAHPQMRPRVLAEIGAVLALAGSNGLGLGGCSREMRAGASVRRDALDFASARISCSMLSKDRRWVRDARLPACGAGVIGPAGRAGAPLRRFGAAGAGGRRAGGEHHPRVHRHRARTRTRPLRPAAAAAVVGGAGEQLCRTEEQPAPDRAAGRRTAVGDDVRGRLRRVQDGAGPDDCGRSHPRRDRRAAGCGVGDGGRAPARASAPRS